MAGIDTKQINTNRRVCEDNTIDSPFNAVMEDADATFPEMLYDRVPGDKAGLLPPNEKNRSR